MRVHTAPWIKRAARVGSRKLAVLIGRRMIWQEQTIRIPLEAIQSVLSPEIARFMLRRMQAVGLISFHIQPAQIEIVAWTAADVF